MRIPMRIKPCPIVEVIVQFHFETSMPDDAVFGIIFQEIREDYPSVEKLPILQLPEAIRTKEPELKKQPHYKLLKDDSYMIQVGPRTISFHCIGEYRGWAEFSSHIYDIIEKIKGLNIIKKVERIGIRYINLLEPNIFRKINLNISLNKEELNASSVRFTAELPSGRYTNILNIVQPAEAIVSGQSRFGAIIDIDSFTTDIKDNFFDIYREAVEEGHSSEKILFFNLLKEEYIQELNPVY